MVKKILLDNEMLGMDGKEIFEAIQARYILKLPNRNNLLDIFEDVFNGKMYRMKFNL